MLQDSFKCVWCEGWLPPTLPEDRHLFDGPCTCILCLECEERILLKDRAVSSHKCRRCLFGFAF